LSLIVSGAKSLLEALRQRKVSVIFGLAGGAIMRDVTNAREAYDLTEEVYRE